MLTKIKISGMSLVETLISVTIMAILFPLMYNLLINVQRSDEMARLEIQLQTDTRKTVQNITNDVREARLIFSPDSTTNINSILPSTGKYQALAATQFTRSDGNFDANTGTKASALALMKFVNRESVDDPTLPTPAVPRVANIYQMIFYFLKLNDQDTAYAPLPGERLRSIIKGTSKFKFYDPSGLTNAEKTRLINRGHVEWIITGSNPPLPKNKLGYPITSEDFNYSTLNLTTVPPGMKNVGGTPTGTSTFSGGVNIPSQGGLFFMRNNDSIKVTVVSGRRLPNRGLRTMLLDTVIMSKNASNN